MSRILVTGASGLIGSALTARLEERGDVVIPVGRRPGKGGVAWDLEKGCFETEPLADIDAIVHLAGEPIEGRGMAAKRRRILESRVGGTELLARLVAQLDDPPAVVVSASAIGYYGDCGDEQLTEESPAGSDFLADVCVHWEKAAAPMASSETRLVLARTGIVCTPVGGALAKMMLPVRLGLGGRLGSGRQWWSWISLEDEVGALIHLLDTPVEGPVNLVAPNPVRNVEFVRAVAAELRRPAVAWVPALALRAVLGEMAAGLVLSSANVRPTRLETSGYRFSSPELSPALSDLLNR